MEAVYGGVSEEEDIYHSFWISDYEDVEKETEELIERYLREQGFAGCRADSILVERDGQVKRVCCYTDSEKRKLCFVVVQKNSDTYWVYGAVRDFQEPYEGGYLVYECDEAGNVTRETEYDVWGKRRAEACYRYHDGIPLPFLTGGWNTDDWHGLCRDKKAWFPEEGVKLVDDLPDDGMQYAGDMEFEYDENGKLKKMHYHRSELLYGTGGKGGEVDFDEQGRMVHDNTYWTHGRHDYYYFYQGDESRPWMEVECCSGSFWGITVYQSFGEEGDILSGQTIGGITVDN